ncbi:vacuolar assembly protein DID2 [Crucibulum laeve]|uniref:Vacuolar assembly protein DID2 n=1 Tax=Crucibulum laeve TaxID=68775 RepID=A0A5C3MEM4_9AGAR|nr:vacuolar assembly protein DID2 [Crucibulum laeve]
MSNLEKTLFQLKFTAKTLSKQAKKAQKDENSEKTKLKKALQQGNNDGARIYASNAIRKKSESLNLLRLSSRLDAVASRVETAVTMRQITGNMTSVVRGMDSAMQSMNLEKISTVMDKFESQFADLDVQTSYMEDTMSSTTAISTPQDQIDQLMRQTAEEANIELQHEMTAKDLNVVADLAPKEGIREEDDKLADRLRALRPAT